MAIYTGEDIEIRIRAVRPSNGQLVTNATAIAEFFAPTKDPIANTDDREDPDESVTLAYSTTIHSYIGHINTADWDTGRWTVRALLTGSTSSMAFSHFTLLA